MTTIDNPDATDPGSSGRDSDALDDQAVDGRGGVEVVRSEQRLDVGTVVRVSGRAVLRRYVVTETVTQTFQVRHEEFRVDHEPIPNDEELDGLDGRAFDDRVVETVLHREVPVVTMQVVATERVRLHVDTVTRRVQVTQDLAHERVDVDVPGQPDARGRA